jgi:hypothetical protein
MVLLFELSRYLLYDESGAFPLNPVDRAPGESPGGDQEKGGRAAEHTHSLHALG